MSAPAASRLHFASPPRRVLVVVTRRIGDVLLSTPVLRSLKTAWPQSQVDVLVFAGTQGFLMGNPDVHRVLTVPERPRLMAHVQFVRSIARRYHLALSLVPGDRPTLYAWSAGRRRAGLLVADDKSLWKRRLLDAWVPFDNADTHTVRMHLALLEVLGIRGVANVLASWTPQDEKLATALLAPLEGARYAVLHPHPKFRYKMWTEDGWIAVGRWLDAHGFRVVLTGGREDAEREYVARVARAIPGALDLAGQLMLSGVALVVARAALYVGPDTAVTHAAAALGVPTVALFGPTNPVKWGPWPADHPADTNPWQRTGSQERGNVRLIQGEGACVPCGNEGCERHVASASDCLTSLPAERVIAQIRDLLG